MVFVLYQELPVNMHIPSKILKRHNTLKIRTNASSFFKLIREVCLILSMTTPVKHSPAQPTECTKTTSITRFPLLYFPITQFYSNGRLGEGMPIK